MDDDQHPTETTAKDLEAENKSFVDKIKPSNLLAWFKGTSRNAKLAMSLALVLVLVGLFSLAFLRENDEPAEFAQEEIAQETEEVASMGAVVTFSEGTLEYAVGDSEWQDVEGELQVEEETKLRTVGATSRAVVTFDDGSAFRIDANSEVEFKSLTVERVVIRLENGYSYSRVLPSESRAFVVTSTDAEYEAVGTAFKSASTGDEQSVEVYHATVHETFTNKKPVQGEKLTVKSAVNPSKDGEIEDIDIEQLKQDQFVQWNKQLDEQDENFKNSLGYLSDFDGPEINITSHNNGDSVLLDSSATEGTVTFTGSTERRATLTVQAVSLSGSQPIDITVGDDGTFTSPVIQTPFGDSSFVFIAEDRRGNMTELVIRLNVQKKSAPVNVQSGGISISSIDFNGSKATVNWNLSGSQTTPDGVKILYKKSSESGELLYGSSSSVHQSDSSAKSGTVKNLDSVSYDFRICVYDANSNTCTKYSTTETESP